MQIGSDHVDSAWRIVQISRTDWTCNDLWVRGCHL